MILRRPPLRGFLLVEVMFVIVIAGMVLWIMSKVILDAIYLQRVATQHLGRTTQIERFVETIRRDACESIWAEWRTSADAARLTLGGDTTGPRSSIEYRLERGRITRWIDGQQTHFWEAPRLSFRAGLERGERHGLLVVSCEEHPPSRATTLPVRTFEVSVLVPPIKEARGATTREGV